MKLLTTIAVLAVLAGVTPAAVAHADYTPAEQGFLDEMQAGGWPSWYLPDAQIADGYKICTEIRHGVPAQFAGREQGTPWIFPGLNDLAQRAAQHNLCPDTLK